MALSHPSTFIPLKEAAKYALSEKPLLDRVKSGRIASAQLRDGALLLAEHDMDPCLNIKHEDFERLRGQQISASEASRKYSALLETTI